VYMCVFPPPPGIMLAATPFFIWGDMPHELPFCSISNVYGSHWDFYQHEAVIVLALLVSAMFFVSAVLLKNIHK